MVAFQVFLIHPDKGSVLTTPVQFHPGRGLTSAGVLALDNLFAP